MLSRTASDYTEIEQLRNTSWAGCRIEYHDCIDSTSVRAAQLAKEGAAHGTVVVADAQTAGRGRKGRSWDSPAGGNLYFSMLLRPELAPDQASMLTLVMALAVKKGIEAACGILAGIKWPNDMVLNGRKITGILTEMCLDGNAIDHIVIGVGINVKKQIFKEELGKKATSIEAETGKEVSRKLLLARILECFEKEYALFLRTQDLALLQEQYNACLVNAGREVRVLDPAGEYAGIAQGINEKGELLVQMSDGTIQRVYAGEVSVRGIYGYV